MSSFHDEYANISIGFGFAGRTKHKQKANNVKRQKHLRMFTSARVKTWSRHCWHRDHFLARFNYKTRTIT